MQNSIATEDRSFFGHPKGLAALFFTELWERFSYYGMRALLVLYMTAETVGANPGMGLGVAEATAIYGLYTFFVYILSLPGGWVADNLWGQRKAVFIGGIIIAAGHFSMAIPSDATFFAGLALIVVGTGLLKPNVSTVVGDLYPEGGARRDAGFSIFYMGINIGGFAGPLLCGWLAETHWHFGFGLAGIGMVLGLIFFKWGESWMGTAGDFVTEDAPETVAKRSRSFYVLASVFAAGIIILGSLIGTGALNLEITSIAANLGVVAVLITLGYFAYVTFFGGHNGEEKKRLGVIFWLFILAALFWSGFEQAGSSMNLFARELTDLSLGTFDVPPSWLQSVNSFFIILLAPLFGILWTTLDRMHANPPIPVKFAMGLLGLAIGFFVLSWGSANASATNQVGMSWLVVTYFFHTCGELCLSPVGLSSMTKLAPKNRVGQMMGIWFVAAALGNLIAGLLAGTLESAAPTALFGQVAMFIGGAGLVALLASPFVQKLMGDVK
jgi:POT family proton-dependent oligopeptide transporter